MCKIKYFIRDPVSVTKKLRPLQAKTKYCYKYKLFVIKKTYF